MTKFKLTNLSVISLIILVNIAFMMTVWTSVGKPSEDPRPSRPSMPSKRVHRVNKGNFNHENQIDTLSLNSENRTIDSDIIHNYASILPHYWTPFHDYLLRVKVRRMERRQSLLLRLPGDLSPSRFSSFSFFSLPQGLQGLSSGAQVGGESERGCNRGAKDCRSESTVKAAYRIPIQLTILPLVAFAPRSHRLSPTSKPTTPTSHAFAVSP